MGYTFDTRVVYSMPHGSIKLATNVSDPKRPFLEDKPNLETILEYYEK